MLNEVFEIVKREAKTAQGVFVYVLKDENTVYTFFGGKLYLWDLLLTVVDEIAKTQGVSLAEIIARLRGAEQNRLVV